MLHIQLIMSSINSYCYNYGDKCNLTIKSLLRYLKILGQFVIYFLFFFDFDTSFLFCGFVITLIFVSMFIFVSMLIFAVQYLTSYLHTTMEITTEKNMNFLRRGKILTNK